MKRGDRPITFRQLRRILGRHNFELRNPHKNFIDIYAVEDEKVSTFFGLRRWFSTKPHKVITLSYAGENEELPKATLKMIREKCSLTDQEGVDSGAFYDQEAIVDYFINHYRRVLQRLAKT